ncbi:MAG: hypothetical protein U0802_01090 [Candidatus Binatia bacterium]
MPSTLRSLTVVATLALSPTLAQAGWVLEWSTTAANQKGASLSSQQATQSVSGNRVRMEQPEVVTIADYNTDRFTMMNPKREYFWSGSSDDYVREMARGRSEAMRVRIGEMTGKKGEKKEAGEPTPRAIDPAKLPPVSITAAGTTEQIAGHEAVKYEVRVDGQLFEELWIAPIDMSADLTYDRYMAQQLKNSAAMQGKSADQYNAVYRDPEYRRLTEKATIVKNVTHHVAGTFTRTATSVAQRDVPDSAFAVPESYRKVRLGDLLEAPPTPAPANSGGQPEGIKSRRARAAHAARRPVPLLSGSSARAPLPTAARVFSTRSLSSLMTCRSVCMRLSDSTSRVTSWIAGSNSSRATASRPRSSCLNIPTSEPVSLTPACDNRFCILP